MRARDTARLMCRCGDRRLKQNRVEKSTDLPVNKKRKKGQGKNWTVKKGRTRARFDAFEVSGI
jgi:hypothetical protein